MGDAGGVAIVNGPAAVPRLEDRFRGQLQLLIRVDREVATGEGAIDFLEATSDHFPVLGLQFGVGFDAGQLAAGGNDDFEGLVRHAHDDATEHLDEAAIEVEDEAAVVGQPGHRLGDLVVEADVEDGVHHAGHGELCARAAGDEQRIVGAAKCLAGQLLDLLHGGQFLLPHAGGEVVAFGQISVAGLSRDGEAGRNGDALAGHVHQTGAFAAQQGAHAVPATADGRFRFFYFAKEIDPLLVCGLRFITIAAGLCGDRGCQQLFRHV